MLVYYFILYFIVAPGVGLALSLYIQGKKFFQMVSQEETNEQLYRARRTAILTSPHIMK